MLLRSIFISNIPVECHIVKGRLESNGIKTFIYGENMVWVHPFRAVAVGGVRLLVPSWMENDSLASFPQKISLLRLRS